MPLVQLKDGKALPMNKIEIYRATLKSTPNWDDYLLEHSGLPGPRGNLELAQAVAQEGDAALFRRYLAFGPEQAPTTTPLAFLAVCGVLGLGRLLAEGEREILPELRRLASDPRWRIREAVAMALQAWGDADLNGLLDAMRLWGQGNPLEQRAAAAALAEPRLLREAGHGLEVLDILDSITLSVEQQAGRAGDEFRVLRQGLGYCWSVVIAALPDPGLRRMERWLSSRDPDVRWIMRENLTKKRLARLDPGWVLRAQAALAAG
jgi:hypothetical protein